MEEEEAIPEAVGGAWDEAFEIGDTAFGVWEVDDADKAGPYTVHFWLNLNTFCGMSWVFSVTRLLKTFISG